MTNLVHPPAPSSDFRHEALFYSGASEFLEHTLAFIAEGLEHEEPVLVVVNRPKIDALRDALDRAAGKVQFADMAEVGHNPARIIPAWRDFVQQNGGGARRLRGIGEPISTDRNHAALAECHRHESLLNVAFAESGEWWLLCPYDTSSLPVEVVDEARRTHPFLCEGGKHRSSPWARDVREITAPFDDPLPEPPAATPEHVFDASQLPAIRAQIREVGVRAGFDATHITDVVLAVDEVVSNSIRHGGGTGVLRIWSDDHALLCDVRDTGFVDDPLVGRHRPAPEQLGGRGLWLVNQLCELVQIRSSRAGTIVRLHFERS
jgi:anti-sigma regulatory factor (Ser/Thr protein kinase)